MVSEPDSAPKGSGSSSGRVIVEAPQRVSGNKGTWPLSFWEHGNKGTENWEHGNKGIF